MFIPIISRSPQVRRTRRNARRDVRTMSHNIKRAAASKGIHNILTLSNQTGVPMRRTATMWFGLSFTITDMTRYMARLDLTVADLFAGTESASEVNA